MESESKAKSGAEPAEPVEAMLDYESARTRSALPTAVMLLGAVSLLALGAGCFLSQGPQDAVVLLSAGVAFTTSVTALGMAYFASRPRHRLAPGEVRRLRWGSVMAGLGLIAGLYMFVLHVNSTTGGGSREAANRIKCGSNLRQVGKALKEYHATFGQLPPDIPSLLAASDLPAAALICPTSDHEPAEPGAPIIYDRTLSYVILTDDAITSGDPNVVMALESPEVHDGDGSNVVFADGSVRFLNHENLWDAISRLQAEGRWPFQVDPTPFLQPNHRRRRATTHPSP